jgi:hypothetical protein
MDVSSIPADGFTTVAGCPRSLVFGDRGWTSQPSPPTDSRLWPGALDRMSHQSREVFCNKGTASELGRKVSGRSTKCQGMTRQHKPIREMSSPAIREKALILLISQRIKNLANSADHFLDFSTLVSGSQTRRADRAMHKCPQSDFAPTTKLQATGFRLQAGKGIRTHMPRQLCNQNSAKSAKSAPNSLPLTTFAPEITNLHRINGLPQNTIFSEGGVTNR